jgi:hypothetical protein
MGLNAVDLNLSCDFIPENEETCQRVSCAIFYGYDRLLCSCPTEIRMLMVQNAAGAPSSPLPLASKRYPEQQS